MSIATILIIAVIAVITLFDIGYLHKNGAEPCGGNCNSCYSTCKWTEDLKKAKRDLDREKQFSNPA